MSLVLYYIYINKMRGHAFELFYENAVCILIFGLHQIHLDAQLP